MLLTLENSKEIVARMSAELTGEVIAIVITDVRQMPEVRRGELRNGPGDWGGSSRKDPLPVKWSDEGIMWLHGGQRYSAAYGRTDIEFPHPGVVVVMVSFGSWKRRHWTFIATERVTEKEAQ